ncbi:MAG: molybdopterin-dependent oxidoreductase [Gammaproteobacteria bacterium]|nr:molybdopterin-dependent oxidoreductase [Gammaproteobacteria bacterium]
MSAIDRRDFLKLVGAGTAGAGAGFLVKESSRNKREQYIPYVATPEDYAPGIANWYKTICTQCSAGCGIEVRVREGRAKKIEGNALHPVSQGSSCALGQSGLNVLYNPDRLRMPQQRSGDKGSDSFSPIGWEQAFTTVAERLAALRRAGKGSRIAVLTGNVPGHMHELLEIFLQGLQSDRYLQYDFSNAESLLAANKASYGRDELPYYDIGSADFLLSFGADYLSHWMSPVHHAIGYGELRNARGHKRGHVTQVEGRMSLSGASADKWLPARPGSEGLIALAIARQLAPGRSDLAAFTMQRAATASDLSIADIEKLAEDFASAAKPLAIAGGAAVHSANGTANAAAINLLNSIGGGAVSGNPDPVIGAAAASRRAGYADMKTLINDMNAGNIDALLIIDTNPVHSLPAKSGLREAIAAVPFVAAISPFLDDTSSLADIVLAPHSYLESWGDGTPQPGVGLSVASIAQPVVAPIHDTRELGDIIIELGRRLGSNVATTLPWDSGYGFFRSRWQGIYESRAGALDNMGFEDFWNSVLQAGVWAEDQKGPALPAPGAVMDPAAPDQPDNDFPFHFQPYMSPAFFDGRGANLPWQQELPDPLTGVVYNSWVELNPATAEKMKLSDGDVVEISSASGSLRAPVIVYPAVRPDVVAMPIGQGHRNFGRYATQRGANPLEIVNEVADRDSGALAWCATMVSVRSVGDRVSLIRNSGTPRELGRSILGPYGEGGKTRHDSDNDHG